MRTAEIRQRWLDYFEGNGHAVVPSASLISPDPSTLFVIAGMVPFIPYMLGEQTPPWPRATSVQKCVRTLDIEEVGKTTRHGTFFQMNGNFSFGDYFKEGAITYAWELVTGSQETGGFGFDPDTIWVTVYDDDDEAARRSGSRSRACPTSASSAAAGRTTSGPPARAGPRVRARRSTSTAVRSSALEGGPVVDEDRYLEIWNLVFMQYERGDGGGKEDFPILGDLKQKNIDTGMGLERVAYLLQGVDNLYEIDEVFPVIQGAQELSGKRLRRGPRRRRAHAGRRRPRAQRAHAHGRRRHAVQRGPRLRAAPPAAPLDPRDAPARRRGPRAADAAAAEPRRDEPVVPGARDELRADQPGRVRRGGRVPSHARGGHDDPRHRGAGRQGDRRRRC